MKSFHFRGVALALGVFYLSTGLHAQQPQGTPSLLPLSQSYPSTQWTNYRWQEEVPKAPGAASEAVVPESTPVPQTNDVQAYSDSHNGPVHHDACSNCGGYHAPGACPSATSYAYENHGGFSMWDAACGCWGWMHSMFNWGQLGCGDGCFSGGCGAGRCGWFAGASGLVMTRDNANHYHFSFENSATTEHIQLLDIRDAKMEWSGGIEARFGRYFNCGQNAWEVVYWGLYPSQQEHTLFGADFANPLDGIHDWSQISIFDPTVPGNVAADGWVDNADAHRLQRDYEFHNIELNLWNLSGSCGDGCQPRFNYNWGFGLRYFRFGEDLLFSAKENGSGVVFDGSTNQVDYLVDVKNNLFGAQIGGDGEYWLTNCLSLTFGGKLGLYGNHINHHSRISSAGNIAFVNNGPLVNSQWDIHSSKNDMAFLGELNVGFDYQINCNWSATLGYRALAVTGVGLTSNQIYSDLRGVNDAAIVDSNGSLILHGGYAGVEYRY